MSGIKGGQNVDWLKFVFQLTPNKLIVGPQNKIDGGGSSGQPATEGRIGRPVPPRGAPPKPGRRAARVPCVPKAPAAMGGAAEGADDYA